MKLHTGRNIFVTGCGSNNVCKTCDASCSKYVKDGGILGIIKEIHNYGINNSISRITFIPLDAPNDFILDTRIKWCIEVELPEQIINPYDI
jgi:hypothetical protein